jgi:hypothetical protein
MLSNIEPPKKLESIITVNDNYETTTIFLNLNNSDINNTSINAVNENIDNKDGNEISETDTINLDQLNNSISIISIGESDLDKKINDEITRETHEENIIINTLNSEILTQQLNDDEIKSNIDEKNTNTSFMFKINALYAYFFKTQNVNLSKNE